MQDSSAGSLRERKAKASPSKNAPEIIDAKPKDPVYGRTPSGQVFAIPETHDVLSGLFNPKLPKSSLDLVTLALLGSQVILWFTLPLYVSKYLFMAVFAVFRLAYNAGLGYILTKQSKQRWIVNTVVRQGFLDGNKRPLIKGWIQRQVEVKMGKDYDFDAMPAEWNVWVLFRHMVDIILLNDFLSYFFCGISWFNTPQWSDSKAVLWFSLRCTAGVTLVLFNIWVKVDAHRIITDLAWYWADSFFVSLQNLVFDGVFEMAPHPMYSVGYAGYYGLSLISGSETVLYVSLAAHACQFAFLVFFEDPHIERTYGERKPLAMRVPLNAGRVSAPSQTKVASSPSGARPARKAKARQSSVSSSNSNPDFMADTPIGTDESDYETDTDATSHGFQHNTARRRDSEVSEDLDADQPPSPRLDTTLGPFPAGKTSQGKPHLRSQHDFDSYYFRNDLLMLQNFDPLRATDFAFALAVFYLVAAGGLTLLSPKAQLVALFANALAWRAFHTFGLGSILKAQSEKKWMVRHYLKHYHYESTGFSAVEEAFSNWKGIYNISLCLVYTSFGMLAFRCYNTALSHMALRHALGLLLISLHIWAARAIFDVIGRYGWNYSDFFISGEGTSPQLLYTGIYRHVNNPERIMGGAAFFGLAIISGSRLVGILAIISVLSHFWFLSCVENPHMKRLYGDALRKETGVSKTLKNAAKSNSHRAPPQVKRAVQELQGTIGRVVDDTQMAVEAFLQRSAPTFNGYVENTKILLREQGERLLITRVANVSSIDRSAYSVSLVPSDLVSGESKDGLPDLPQARHMPKYILGEPITINWTAPSNCTRKDWIGLYRFKANKSKLVTRIRSHGRWLGIYPDQWNGDESLATDGASGSVGPDGPQKKGSLTFKDKKLFWKAGQYEFRYHHNGKHNAMAVSEPFEITVEKPRDLKDGGAVYKTLLPLVTRCLNSDPDLVPEAAFPLLREAPSAEAQEKIHASRTDKDDFVIFDIEQAARIAEVVKESCGLELTAEVIVAEANVARLARSPSRPTPISTAHHGSAPTAVPAWKAAFGRNKSLVRTT